jgi:L-asparaginase
MRSLVLMTTGGTIEKVYDPSTGMLENRGSIVRRMFRRLRLEGTHVRIVELMSKDSLLMTDADRARMVEQARLASEGDARHPAADAVLILHGTDTLTVTGETLHQAGPWGCPIVLTGAMRPYEMARSDALQNLTEALLASSLVQPGVYCVCHGRVLAFPGVVKDKTNMTFMKPGA